MRFWNFSLLPPPTRKISEWGKLFFREFQFFASFSAASSLSSTTQKRTFERNCKMNISMAEPVVILNIRLLEWAMRQQTIVKVNRKIFVFCRKLKFLSIDVHGDFQHWLQASFVTSNDNIIPDSIENRLFFAFKILPNTAKSRKFNVENWNPIEYSLIFRQWERREKTR